MKQLDSTVDAARARVLRNAEAMAQSDAVAGLNLPGLHPIFGRAARAAVAAAASVLAGAQTVTDIYLAAPKAMEAARRAAVDVYCTVRSREEYEREPVAPRPS